MTLDSTVVVCAHNEEFYIEACLRSILAQGLPPSRIMLVADRCSDGTEDLARNILPAETSTIVKKHRSQWKNSISENLELARRMSIGDGFVVVDADMVLPADFLERLLPQLREYASVSALARTDPTQGILNGLVSAWERTYLLAPLGAQPRGGCRVVSLKVLNEIGGFHDVTAWDTDLDMRLREAGYRVKIDRGVAVLHRRRMTIRRSITYQIQTGRARRELGISLGLTLIHSIGRVRPFVLYGYLKKDSGAPLGHQVEVEILG